MRDGKHGLKALVLAIMTVLGAMVFTSGAQAQTHTELLTTHANHNKSGGTLNPNPLTHGSGSALGQFLVNLGPALLAAITGALEGPAVLLIAGRSLEIKCTALEFIETKIDSSTDALGEATFTGCKSFDHKTLNELVNCQFKTLETIRMRFLILPITHGGEPFLLFEPQNAGEPFSTVSYKPGIGCTLPLNNLLAGSFAALVEQLDAIKQTILFNEGIQLLIGDLLTLIGASPAYLTAKVAIELSGTHLDQKLGIHGSAEWHDKMLHEIALHAKTLQEIHKLKLHAEILHAISLESHTELLTAHANHNKSGGTLNPNPLTHGSGSALGQFLVNLGSALLATVTATQEGTGVLLVAGRSLEIRCTELTLNNAKIDSSTDALGEATFTGCKSFDHKTLVELTNCQLKELETIKTKFLVLPITHGEENFLLFEPQEGTAFATVSYKPGIGCTLPLNNSVTGSVVALVDELDAIAPTIKFSKGVQLLVGDLLAFGGFPSYIAAEGRLALVGAHVNQKLGIH